MPDYTYSRRYKKFVNDVRQSRWSGTYGGRMGSVRLDDDEGEANDDTTLDNIQYVPSETQLIVAAEWEHKGSTGQMVLIIDYKNPKQLKGYYRTDGEDKWSSGTARRTD